MHVWAALGIAVAVAIVVGGTALALGVLAMRWPHVVLAVLAALTPFGSTIELPLPPPINDLSSLIAAIAVAAFAGHLMVTARAGERPGAPATVWSLLIAWVSLTVLWSLDPAHSLGSVLILAALFMLYLLVALTPVSARDLRVFEVGVVFSGVLVAVYAVYLAGTGALIGAVDQRFVATIGGSETNDVADPNITAASLLLPFFLCVSWGVHSKGWWRRAVSFLSAGMVFVAIFLTGSRGGLLALVLGLGVIVWSSPYRKQALLALALPVLGFFLAMSLAPEGVSERVGDSRSSGRTDIWRIALMACPRYCLPGSGWGTFADVHEQTLLSEPSAVGIQQRYEAHSIWVGALIEGGIVALTLLAVALIVTWRTTAAIVPSERGTSRAALLSTVFAASLIATFGFKYFWLVLIYISLATRVHASERGPHQMDAPQRQRDGADVATPT